MGEISLPFPYAARTRIAHRARRALRKHRAALLSLGVLLAILFFPSLFMGRVLSPNDVYYHYQPWASMAKVEAQNPLIHDPPTAYITLISLLKNDPASFHWNRYVASGIPGFGSVAAAVLSPFIAIPALLLPLVAVYSGIILGKIVFSFATAYLWLREERLGKIGAAAGATVFAGAGVYAVWWLWQGTNATSLYAITLYLIARAFHGKRNPTWLLVAVFVSYLVSGFPAPVAYGAYAMIAYIVYKAIVLRAFPRVEIGRFALAAILALLIAAPLLQPFVRLIQQSGYLERRERTSYTFFYPREHLWSFVDPYRLGDPAAHRWVGSQDLAISDNFVEATIYVGAITLALAAIALVRRRSWFWAGFAALLVVLMFFDSPLSRAAAALPGVKYSPLGRLRVLLPVAFAFLAASGMATLGAAARRSGRLQWIVRPAIVLLTIALAADLGLFAARFYGYVRPEVARVAPTPLVEFLQREPGPFRIAPFFDMMFPNTSELMQVEDIRAHWGSERTYRDLMQRFDPSSATFSTIILFNSLQANLADPILSLLNVRYLYEGHIDILRWSVYKGTLPAERAAQQPLWLLPGHRKRRTITIDEEGVHALEFDALLRDVWPGDSGLDIRLTRPESGETLFARTYAADELRKMPKLYIPISPYARRGNALVIEVHSRGVRLELVRGPERGGESPLTFGRVTAAVVPTHAFPEGPLFRNLGELPRHYAVWNLLTMSDAELLKRSDVDFGTTAVVERPDPALAAKLAAVPPPQRNVRFRLLRYSGSEHLLETRSAVPFLMATSEKLTPELRVEIDGRRVEPVEIDWMFAGVPVEKGTHRIRLVRRIGGAWWWASALGVVALAGAMVGEKRWKV